MSVHGTFPEIERWRQEDLQVAGQNELHKGRLSRKEKKRKRSERNGREERKIGHHLLFTFNDLLAKCTFPYLLVKRL